MDSSPHWIRSGSPDLETGLSLPLPFKKQFLFSHLQAGTIVGEAFVRARA